MGRVRVPSLRRRYPASTVVRTHPPSASAGAGPHGFAVGMELSLPPRSQTSLVAHHSCSVRAAIITPVESSAAYLARFTDDSDLPRYSGGSAPTLALSRPAQCSLTLRPARSADPLRGLSIEVLQIIRRLLIRSDRFRLEREFAGPDFHRGERCALPRHTEQSGREFASADPTARAQDATLQERRFCAKIPLHPRAAYNIFNVQRHLTSAQSHRVLRAVAMSTWREVVAAA